MRTLVRSLQAAALAAAGLVLPARPAAAQMPGAPVLQNAFSNTGVTVAANFADGTGTTLTAAAVAWSPGSGRFQLSGGGGRLRLDDEGTGSDDVTGTAWGARVGVPLFELWEGRIGVAPFVGVGGMSTGDARLLQVPAGVGAGWRTALGETRALSFYATGTYLWARTEVDDARRDDGRIRFAVAGDVTVVSNLGLTLGYETGGSASVGESGPQGSIFGVGLSWAFR